MLRFILFFLFVNFFNLNLSFAKNSKNALNILKPKVVYGKDNRKEFYEVKNKTIKDLSLSTVALFSTASLLSTNATETLFDIDAETLEESYQLCSTEKYLAQPTGAFCTGFLIAPQLVMSAGHCITSQFDCEDTQFVFDYKLTKKGQTTIQISSSSMYSCDKLISREESITDYSIIKLDRPVTDRQPLKIRKIKEIQKDTSVFVIGHPSGLPLKITQKGAKVSQVENTYFLANLDTFQGNSGSPVFHSKTNEVEGILARGETDYTYNSKNSCYVVNTCLKENNCSGEGVIKITSLYKQINKALNLVNKDIKEDQSSKSTTCTVEGDPFCEDTSCGTENTRVCL
ncbi:MAG: trypsin-like peptidase domain-containing protein [Bdellovibrionaceae bacterium]|nr:trypsin-like peptidase domain-containing protein [Pseudobdellovibrionaceae bacterium]